jgi:hypothetical protein
VVSEDPGREDLRSLHLGNKELDRETDCKAVAKFYLKGKESIGRRTHQRKSADLFV